MVFCKFLSCFVLWHLFSVFRQNISVVQVQVETGKPKLSVSCNGCSTFDRRQQSVAFLGLFSVFEASSQVFISHHCHWFGRPRPCPVPVRWEGAGHRERAHLDHHGGGQPGRDLQVCFQHLRAGSEPSRRLLPQDPYLPGRVCSMIFVRIVSYIFGLFPSWMCIIVWFVGCINFSGTYFKDFSYSFPSFFWPHPRGVFCLAGTATAIRRSTTPLCGSSLAFRRICICCRSMQPTLPCSTQVSTDSDFFAAFVLISRLV